MKITWKLVKQAQIKPSVAVASVVLAIASIGFYHVAFLQAQAVVDEDSRGACYYYQKDSTGKEIQRCNVTSKADCDKYGTYGYTDPDNTGRVPNSTFVAGKDCPKVPFKIYDDLSSGNVVTVPGPAPRGGYCPVGELFEDRGDKDTFGFSVPVKITPEEALCDPKTNLPTQKLKDQCAKKIKDFVTDNDKTSQCERGFIPVVIAGPYTAAEYGDEWRNRRGNFSCYTYDHICWVTCRAMVACVPVPSPTPLPSTTPLPAEAPMPTIAPSPSSTPVMTPSPAPTPTIAPTLVPTIAPI